MNRAPWGSRRRITGFTEACLLTLAAGCTGSGAAGPPAKPAPHFHPIPGAPVFNGKTEYLTILGPVTGSGPATFTIPVRPAYMAWLGCIGTGGMVMLSSPVIDYGVPCGDSGSVAGWIVEPAPPARGPEVTIRITAPPHARWDLRIDGAPRPG
jgi:hypothetical protein